MNKRGTGTIFCLIAAILFSTRYITAAIYMSGASSWDANLFSSGLEYVGSPLFYLSIISLMIGVGYLIWGELEDKKKK